MTLSDRYSVQKVKKPHAITAEVPGSKSITNRALLLAALAQGRSVLHGVLFSDDSRYFLSALGDLGFEVEIDEENKTVAVTGCGGRIPREEAAVYVGSAGTAARFLTAFLGLSDGRYHMNSSEQMKKRPMQELLVTLEDLGAEICYEEEQYHFPYTIGKRTGGVGVEGVTEDDCTAGNGIADIDSNVDEITIDVDKSSQFLSALLIVSVLFSHDFTIHVTGTHGMAYVRMTVEMMRQFGLSIEVSDDERTYRIPANAAYQPREYRIEPDISAACYFYAAGAILGVPARVLHVHSDSMQGDIAFLSVLCDMGCTYTEEPDGITVISGCRLHGGSWDLSAFSDQALTLAAIAPFADAPVRICGIGHIRYQECDRIAAIIENLHAMGVRCTEENGNIIIMPSEWDADAGCESDVYYEHHTLLHGAEIQTYEDHRVAMAFTIPGLLLDGQVILNPSCCRKTFENFYAVLEEALQ